MHAHLPSSSRATDRPETGSRMDRQRPAITGFPTARFDLLRTDGKPMLPMVDVTLCSAFIDSVYDSEWPTCTQTSVAGPYRASEGNRFVASSLLYVCEVTGRLLPNTPYRHTDPLIQGHQRSFGAATQPVPLPSAYAPEVPAHPAAASVRLTHGGCSVHPHAAHITIVRQE